MTSVFDLKDGATLLRLEIPPWTPSVRMAQASQTPVKSGLRVPPGHVLAAERWKGTEIVTSLRAAVKVVYEEDLGVVDFHPSGDMGVVYLTEAEQLAGNSYRRKLVKLRMADKVRGVVIVEKTQATEQYFSKLQKFVVMDLGLCVIPVPNQDQAAKLIAQLVQVENRPQMNQFKIKRKSAPTETRLLTTMKRVPRLGQVKAEALLQHFHSIKRISNASIEELTPVVGRSAAVNVKAFFSQTQRS